MNFVGTLNLRRMMCLLVRHNFASECEAVINKQINLELKACHEYLSMAYHFNRSDVAMTGAYGFFKKASDEERTHAELLMQYMNKRGGQIILESVPKPKCSYESITEAMMDALQLEKDVNEALLEAHAVATKENDPNMCDFIESNFLQEQVDALKQLADYVKQIERCENNLGTQIFDSLLKDSSVH